MSTPHFALSSTLPLSARNADKKGGHGSKSSKAGPARTGATGDAGDDESNSAGCAGKDRGTLGRVIARKTGEVKMQSGINLRSLNTLPISWIGRSAQQRKEQGIRW